MSTCSHHIKEVSGGRERSYQRLEAEELDAVGKKAMEDKISGGARHAREEAHGLDTVQYGW